MVARGGDCGGLGIHRKSNRDVTIDEEKGEVLWTKKKVSFYSGIWYVDIGSNQ